MHCCLCTGILFNKDFFFGLLDCFFCKRVPQRQNLGKGNNQYFLFVNQFYLFEFNELFSNPGTVRSI